MVMNVANALNAYRQTSSGATNILGNDSSSDEGVSSFGNTLKTFMGDSLNTLKKGEQAATAGAVGKANMQDVVMAVDKAGTVLDTVLALRDKVVSAYQEILRMQI